MNKNNEYIKKLVEITKECIGKKCILSGGGMVANEFYIVKLLALSDDGEAVVKYLKGDSFRENVECSGLDGERVSIRMLNSWKISPISKEFEFLPYMKIIVTGDRIIDADSIGLFGSIYDGKTIAEFDKKDNKWNMVLDENEYYDDFLLHKTFDFFHLPKEITDYAFDQLEERIGDVLKESEKEDIVSKYRMDYDEQVLRLYSPPSETGYNQRCKPDREIINDALIQSMYEKREDIQREIKYGYRDDLNPGFVAGLVIEPNAPDGDNTAPTLDGY